MNSRKILSFFPHCPVPPRTGAHRRCLEMLCSLKELGCEVHLASAVHTSETLWDAAAVQYLNDRCGVNVHIAGLDEPFLFRIIDFLKQSSPYRWKWRFERTWQHFAPDGASRWCTPGMVKWFQRLGEQLAPDVIMMNYVMWDGLIPHSHWAHINRLIDTHDLWSLNTKLRALLAPYITHVGMVSGEVSDEILHLNFFEQFELAADDEEFRAIDKYRYGIAISKRESELIAAKTQSVDVRYVPMSFPICNNSNNYSSIPIMTLSPSMFNLQGYFLFTKKILPHILRKVPNFRVHVTGLSTSSGVWIPDGVGMLGFVPDLTVALSESSFAINPIFGGTGQQIKTIEAMAHGLPVILFGRPATESPVRHGENGFVADSPEAFAEYCCVLWKDRALVRRLGQCARETVRTECSRNQTVGRLAQILD
jgi:hypothetical protein